MTKQSLPVDPKAKAPEAGRDEVIRGPLPTRVDRSAYLPAPLHIIANVLTWGASRIYRRHFGIGANEWRILGALSMRAGITASEACAMLGMNKSIASMSIRKLQEKGMIVIEPDEGAKRIYLTGAGAQAHDAMVPIANARQAILLSRLSAEEAVQFRGMVDRLEQQLGELQAYDEEMAGPAEDERDPGS